MVRNVYVTSTPTAPYHDATLQVWVDSYRATDDDPTVHLLYGSVRGFAFGVFEPVVDKFEGERDVGNTFSANDRERSTTVVPHAIFHVWRNDTTLIRIYLG